MNRRHLFKTLAGAALACAMEWGVVTPRRVVTVYPPCYGITYSLLEADCISAEAREKVQKIIDAYKPYEVPFYREVEL